NIKLYNVAVLNPALAANSMNNFVVQRDANAARKNSVAEAITEKRAFHLRLLHKIRGRLVDFFGRDSRTNQLAYPIENLAGRATSLSHFLHFLSALNWNHAVTLSSISRAISAKTVSRSLFPSTRRKIDTFP